MEKPITSFERREQKYLVCGRTAEVFLAGLLKHMYVDEYANQLIRSVYYDTDDFSVIRRSMSRPPVKEKLRLRSYGETGENDKVFLELKKKFDGIVYKKRVVLTKQEADDFVVKGIRPPDYLTNKYFYDDADAFIANRQLKKKILILSKRFALKSDECPFLRVTFDSDIRYRTDLPDLHISYGGKEITGKNCYIVEVKSSVGLPLWLCRLLSENALYPTGFSKYAVCYRDLTEHEQIKYLYLNKEKEFRVNV